MGFCKFWQDRLSSESKHQHFRSYMGFKALRLIHLLLIGNVEVGKQYPKSLSKHWLHSELLKMAEFV